MQSLLDGKVALVTGGAGGIGSAISRALAEAGLHVVVSYNRNAERARALIDTLPGNQHVACPAQIDNSNSLSALVASIRDRYGRLDVLVNNAGTTRYVPHADLDALDDALIDEIFRVNWRGSFATTRACRGLLSESGDGLIVNITSIAGSTGNGSNIAYCASKAALNMATLSLARALAPSIRVVAVAPGLVEGEYASGFDQAWKQAQVDKTPLGRLATPNDVAQTVVALMTHLRFVTGAIIPVDGGRPLT